MCILFLSCGAAAQRGPYQPHSWGFKIAHNDAPQSVGLLWTSIQFVAEISLYLTTHNIHNRKSSMAPAGFEPTIPASKRPQTYALHGPATGTGLCMPTGRSRVRFSMVSLEFIRELYRCINDIKGYQSRTNIIKDENSDLVTDSHSILARKSNHFCQLLNVYWLVISANRNT